MVPDNTQRWETGHLLRNAVREGRADLVTVLLKGGADVDAESEWGETPLQLAVKGCHVEIVEALLGNGAGPSLENDYG